MSKSFWEFSDSFNLMQLTVFSQNIRHCWAMHLLFFRFKSFVNDKILSIFKQATLKKTFTKTLWNREKKDCSELQRLNKIEIVICSDSRCVLFFDSTRDFQFHCQDVHCVDRVKKITTKKRRCTFRSKMNVISKLHSHLKSKHDYALIERKILFRCVNRLTNTLAFKFIDLIYSIKLIKSNEQSHDYVSK